jgi:hypothetical protein
VTPVPLLYVAGTSFTGSTLLSLLLDAHAEIASVGEATGPAVHVADRERFPCSCGVPIRECGFWKRVAEGMRERGFAFDPLRPDTSFDLSRGVARHLLVRSLRSNALDALRDRAVAVAPGWGARLREIGLRNRALVGSVLDVTGKRVFADATKDPTRVRYLARYAGVEPRVVHLVRDPLGFVSSNRKNRRESVAEGIARWLRTARTVERLRRVVPAGGWLLARYEDLCADPERQLRAIADFAGVAPPPVPIDFRAGEHHVIGNRMRLASSSEIALDESWRERLSSSDVEDVLRRTAPFRRALGYPERP